MKERNSDKDVEKWFNKYIDDNGDISYYANIIKTSFNDWIDSGMK